MFQRASTRRGDRGAPAAERLCLFFFFVIYTNYTVLGDDISAAPRAARRRQNGICCRE